MKTIGKQLKKTRILLGLTQAEMADRIITESFYSRVENGKNEISINDLLKILNAHQVSLFDFFNGVEECEPKAIILQKRIIRAFIDCDVTALEKINSSTDQHKIQLEIQLMVATIKKSTSQLIASLQKEMKDNLLQIGSWNEKSLWQLAISFPLYSFKEGTLLINSIYEKENSFDFNNLRVLLAIAFVELNYLQLCFQNDREKEGKLTIYHLKKLPASAPIFLPKLLANYCLASFDHDFQKKKEIYAFMKEMNYLKYLEYYFED